MTFSEDIAVARRILDACRMGDAEIVPLTRFNHPVFRVTGPEGAWVLKLAKSADGAATRKESLTIERLQGQGIPVARVERVDEDGTLAGRPFLLMTSAGEQTVADLLETGDLARSLLQEMGTILARVHRLPASAFSDLPADRISAVGIASYLDSLTAVADALAAQGFLERSELTRFRAATMPVAEGNSLCHSDYHAVQCVVRDERISAVVDWESAWIGNPTIDLAISHAYLDFYCPRELTRAFLDGYESIGAIPAGYGQDYLPVRMAQTLGMLRAWYTRGENAWQAAIAQGKVARAVNLLRLYAARLQPST
jgi:aminoglycoside phosphotransferase (APT) family kinase protein